MSLEIATFITDLVTTNPVGNADDFSTGAAHLRLIKSVLKATFPNVNAQVTASSADLNLLVDKHLTPTQIKPYPSGTKKLFMQAAAPVGWTQDITQNDKVFRIVDGSTGNIGGTSSGAWAISGITFASTALTEYQMPIHTHGTLYDGVNIPGAQVEGIIGVAPLSNSDKGGGSNLTSRALLSVESSNPSVALGSASPHSHGAVTADGAWRPPYTDTLVCTKNAT